MKIIKIFILGVLILFFGTIFLGYIKAKKDGNHFYDWGMFFHGMENVFYVTLNIKSFSTDSCLIKFSSDLNEAAREKEELRIGCSSQNSIKSIKEVSNILDTFLKFYDTKNKLKHVNTLSLQIISRDYYFADFLQELNHSNIWNKKDFYGFINYKKTSFLFSDYIDNLSEVISSSKTFNPLYKVLKKHGCSVSIPKDGLAIELFDRSFINNIKTPQYYLHQDLQADNILGSEDVNKTIYPHIGMIFFNVKCN